MTKITIDDVEYDMTNATKEAEAKLTNITFVNEMILQKNNELNIAKTAKIGYSRALKRELETIKKDNVWGFQSRW